MANYTKLMELSGGQAAILVALTYIETNVLNGPNQCVNKKAPSDQHLVHLNHAEIQKLWEDAHQPRLRKMVEQVNKFKRVPLSLCLEITKNMFGNLMSCREDYYRKLMLVNFAIDKAEFRALNEFLVGAISRGDKEDEEAFLARGVIKTIRVYEALDEYNEAVHGNDSFKDLKPYTYEQISGGIDSLPGLYETMTAPYDFTFQLLTIATLGHLELPFPGNLLGLDNEAPREEIVKQMIEQLVGCLTNEDIASFSNL